MRNIIIGRGEIGSAVGKVLALHDQDVSSYDKQGGEQGVFPHDQTFDILHICIPYTDKFVRQVRAYQKKYKPRFTIIWSTVQVGTTKQLERTVHSPVEGKHPDLDKSIKYMRRWVGANTEANSKFAFTYFNKLLKLPVQSLPSSDFTEALKLLSTTEYGVNIAFAAYKKFVADSIDMPFELTKQWNRDYNDLYRRLGSSGQFQKFVLDPPDKKIGGHCVIPNAELLEESYPDDFIDMLLEYK